MNATLFSALAATASQRAGRVGSTPAMKPLVLAILAAFPLYGVGQTAVVRPAAPAVAAVPRPMPGWRVSGTGAAAPLNTGNTRGGVDQSITQTSQRGIYNWQSFDIGANSSVTFNFPSGDSSSHTSAQATGGLGRITVYELEWTLSRTISIRERSRHVTVSTKNVRLTQM